ncbi:MAG: dihydrofolate reductase family protein [Cyclobacteriaceae bacterium]|nr:dihydrofolate reductase family protein [Cyclobacteriaceae bacterium]
MRKIVYYIASSIDGFITGHNDDVSEFVGTGDGVDRYLTDLSNFDTVIMGRNTYEFGYKYGLKPGQPAYPHMKHYIFSNSLKLENANPQVQVKKMNLVEIDKLQKEQGTDIYLCGGGQFAGWLLDNQKINTLKLKLNPLILGEGVKLFGNSTSKYKLELADTANYENGLQIMTFNVIYL